MAAALFCVHPSHGLDIARMCRLCRRLRCTARDRELRRRLAASLRGVRRMLWLFAWPMVVAAQHRTFSARRDSVSLMAIALGTTVSPAINNRARSEGLLTQPMLALRGARSGGVLQYVVMLNAERWTMPDGEPVAGIWGEGFIDRRHPHTVIHEAMVTGNLTRPGMQASLAGGRGFVPFGTDDPMVRPFVKYPANHHHAQVMERVQLVLAARFVARASLELSAFNGDEPLSPTAAPQWSRFGDSRSVRVTVWPARGVELQGSAERQHPLCGRRSRAAIRVGGMGTHRGARRFAPRRAVRHGAGRRAGRLARLGAGAAGGTDDAPRG
jgi:hypothetical protein